MFELETLEALESIKADGPLDSLYGLCLNLDWQVQRVVQDWDSINRSRARFHSSKWLEQIVDAWPMNNGTSVCFPIPAPADSGMSNGFYYMNTPEKWDKSTEYGQARWALVDFAIEYMKKVQSDESSNS